MHSTSSACIPQMKCISHNTTHHTYSLTPGTWSLDCLACDLVRRPPQTSSSKLPKCPSHPPTMQTSVLQNTLSPPARSPLRFTTTPLHPPTHAVGTVEGSANCEEGAHDPLNSVLYCTARIHTHAGTLTSHNSSRSGADTRKVGRGMEFCDLRGRGATKYKGAVGWLNYPCLCARPNRHRFVPDDAKYRKYSPKQNSRGNFSS